MMGDQNLGQMTAEQLQQKGQSTVIFLHGLLQSGRTWRQFVLNDNITENRDVILVDLRNHGESDHHENMSYTDMSNDLARFLDQRQLEQVILVGHNIGGKTAMTFAG